MSVTSTSMNKLLKNVPSRKLDQPCKDDHLSEVALSITEWRSIAPFLGLTRAEECEIQNDCGKMRTQKIEMLRKWREKYGNQATYRRLAKVFFKLGHADLVEELCELVHPELQSAMQSSTSTDLVEANRNIRCSYANTLRIKYRSRVPTFLSLQWPPPPTFKVFNLAMISQERVLQYGQNEELVRLLLRGNVSGIMSRRNEVTLKKLSDEVCSKSRKIILIEGAPGAGKSTLAWHLCQKWDAGELFQEFEVVLFVQLREPAIQSAQSLEDLFHTGSRISREAVSAIQYCGGQKVLIVLDSWDEYTPGLHEESVIKKLICNPPDLNMQHSALIITSRPIATAKLQRFTSTRIEIVGFLPTEIKRYFTEAIGDPEVVQKLTDHLSERPVIEASCYLPLNTAIVTHLFLALNHTLPTTLHGVFTSLVMCCIIRHLEKQAGEWKEIPRISSLDDLPPSIQEHFENICTLAYHGVRDNKATFSGNDLKLFKLPTELSTLSLIQGVASFTAFGESKLYNFLHLSTQELLAAFFISKMPSEEQVKIFSELFNQPRFSAVFQFYAAFTKLKTEGIRDTVSNIVKSKDKTILMSLLHCLYEAQDSTLCQFVASQLKQELDLFRHSLSPVDCLSVGYFLTTMCLTTAGKFILKLTNDRLDEYCASLLVRELSRCNISSDPQTQTVVKTRQLGYLELRLEWHRIDYFPAKKLIESSTIISKLDLSYSNNMNINSSAVADVLTLNQSLKALNLNKTGLNSAGAISIARVLQQNNSLEELSLELNGIGDMAAIALADTLQVNQKLTILNLYNTCVTSTGAIAVARALEQNGSLEELNLGFNEIRDLGATALANALQVNKSLTTLNLYNTGMTLIGAKSMARGLQQNSSLKELNLKWNRIGDSGTTSLADAVKVNQSLTALNLYNTGLTSTAIIDMARALKHNNMLEELNLGFNRIGDEGAIALADALQVNHTLTILNLYDTGLTSTGATAMARALKQNSSLEELNFEFDGIGEGGAFALAEALQENWSLRRLNLLGNRIGDDLAFSMADALQVNQSLTTLNLGFNGIGDEGATALADALQVNQSLTILNLESNGIGDEGAIKLAGILQVNQKLTTLNLDSNIITNKGATALGDALKANKKLETLILSQQEISGWTLYGNERIVL